jgi:thiol-disulfide isomerase/thioredoxin
MRISENCDGRPRAPKPSANQSAPCCSRGAARATTTQARRDAPARVSGAGEARVRIGVGRGLFFFLVGRAQGEKEKVNAAQRALRRPSKKKEKRKKNFRRRAHPGGRHGQRDFVRGGVPLPAGLVARAGRRLYGVLVVRFVFCLFSIRRTARRARSPFPPAFLSPLSLSLTPPPSPHTPSPHSGPCRMMAPIFESLAKKFPALTFVKVDVDAHQSIAAGAGGAFFLGEKEEGWRRDHHRLFFFLLSHRHHTTTNQNQSPACPPLSRTRPAGRPAA